MTIREIEVKLPIVKTNLPIGDYSVNPYVGCPHACRYCYASFMKRFTGHIEPWGEFLDVKVWEKIKNPTRYKGKELFVGSVTDPYNPYEEQYRKTRAFLEEMKDSGAKISIQTKSSLVLRNLDLLRVIPNIRVGFSINTLDESFKDDMDKASSIESRLNAMETLHREGIRTTAFISPIFPGITDVKAIIERVKDKSNLIWLEDLNLRGSFKGDILSYISSRHPDLVDLYDAIYCNGDRTYWRDLDDSIRAYCKEQGLLYVLNDDNISRPFDAPPVVVNYFCHSEIKRGGVRYRKNA